LTEWHDNRNFNKRYIHYLSDRFMRKRDCLTRHAQTLQPYKTIFLAIHASPQNVTTNVLTTINRRYFYSITTLHLMIGQPCSGKNNSYNAVGSCAEGLRLIHSGWQQRLFGQDATYPEHN